MDEEDCRVELSPFTLAVELAIQLKVLPETDDVKFKLTCAPEHMVTLGKLVTAGVGLTFTVKVRGELAHPLNDEE
jgi:hypothetical protein